MFTGIIEDLGVVERTTPSTLSVRTALDAIKPGDSVAVNGACLTATAILPAGPEVRILTFDYSPETGARTSLDNLTPGSRVNLERALRVGDRLGGHFLSGHVEGTGTILDIRPAGNSALIKVSLPPGMEKYAAEKGSIGVDGISLTAASRASGSVTVSVIPYTLQHTTLRDRKRGDIVNLEPDLLAKYVERLLEAGRPNRGVNRGLLEENGFI